MSRPVTNLERKRRKAMRDRRESVRPDWSSVLEDQSFPRLAKDFGGAPSGPFTQVLEAEQARLRREQKAEMVARLFRGADRDTVPVNRAATVARGRDGTRPVAERRV